MVNFVWISKKIYFFVVVKKQLNINFKVKVQLTDFYHFACFEGNLFIKFYSRTKHDLLPKIFFFAITSKREQLWFIQNYIRTKHATAFENAPKKWFAVFLKKGPLKDFADYGYGYQDVLKRSHKPLFWGIFKNRDLF